MTTSKQTALKTLSLLDLTSLNHSDTKDSIKILCNKAISKHGNVASVCIYPEFIPFAKDFLKGKNIKITTVINFPDGNPDVESAVSEAKDALLKGADEFDLVIPYKELMNGNEKIVSDMVKAVRDVLPSSILKVIIESGVLKKTLLIKKASELAINAGADFIKTSTGKAEVSATLEAANAMLEVIKESGKSIGFKAAGGIKTVAEADDYLKLGRAIINEDFLNKNTFRFGASSMLSDISDIIENKNTPDNKEKGDY